MKKALAIAVVLGLAVTAAYASPMGPVKPTMGRFGLEFEVGAGQRDMEREIAANNKMEAENLMFLGRLSYGLTDKVELTVRLGAQDLDADFTAPTTGNYDGNSKFAWGVGLSGILYEAGTWNIAGVANYFSSSSHNGRTTGNIGATTNTEVDYFDWNIGLQIQGKYDQFLPYLGVKYSDAKAEIDRWNNAAITNGDYEAEDNVGIYVGAGFDLTPQWSGYVEGRFIDETSFGGGIRYTF
jgi:hypothetical protein